MNLGHYLTVLWRRKWGILAVVVAALVVVAIGLQTSTPVYEATAVLRVAIYATASQAPTLYNYNDELMNTFVKVATSSSMMEELADRLQVSHLPTIKVEAISGTELILVTASDTDPESAMQAANALAEMLVEQGRELYAGSGVDSKNVLAGQLERSKTDLDVTRKEYEKLIVQTPAAVDELTLTGQFLQEKQRTYETLLRQYEQAEYREALEAGMITLVERAPLPVSSTQQSRALIYLLTGGLGLMVGGVMAFLIDRMDTRLYTTSEIESMADVPSLAKLPKTSSQHLHLSKNGTSPLADSVRQLAVNLQMTKAKPPQVLMLVGAEPGQGATTTISNLGSALSELKKKVLLVDFNVRDPQLQEVFNLPNEKGVVDVLSGGVELDEAIQTGADGQPALLTTGPVDAPALLTLDPEKVTMLFKTLRQRFDFILVDVPALPLAETVTLAPHADALILVARRSHVRRDSVRSAREALSHFNEKFMGVIINETEKQGAYAIS